MEQKKTFMSPVKSGYVLKKDFVLNICNVVWRVKQVSELRDEQDRPLDGRILGDQTLLLLDVNQPEDRKIVSFIHELLHALLCESRIGVSFSELLKTTEPRDAEETLINLLAPVVYNVLVSNNWEKIWEKKINLKLKQQT